MFPGWFLVKEKTECTGSESGKGYLPSIEDCASHCTGIASMFIFGTNDYGTTRCNENGCQCYCETSATTDGECDQTTHNGFRLYKYGNQGNYLFVLTL